ncbi:MAG: sodium:solute symporter, partial [bacterium]|nr:sodium:solute symporter [bacterium]
DWVYFNANVAIVLITPVVVSFYLPFFRRLKVTSAYEYLEKRFNLPVRLFASFAFILYQLGRMAIVLFLPAIALATVTGVNVYVCILVMGLLCTFYTVLGGMEAVIWTDVLQVVVLLGGALLSLALIAFQSGGFGAVLDVGFADDKFRMANWTWDYTTAAVWVVLFGNLFSNLGPYTSDQTVVQRYLTTSSEKEAARAIWTNAAMVIPGTVVWFGLGTALYAFYKSHPEQLDPATPTDAIFPLFIAEQLPAGISGLIIAAVFAASMSTLDSSLNSVSTAVVTDFFRRFRQDVSDAVCFRLARWLTGVLGVAATSSAILLATFNIGSLWDAFQMVMGLFGGALAGLFALGIFTRRATGAGALVGALTSAGVLYLVQSRTEVHFFLYAVVGVLTCVLVGYCASLLLP